MRGGEGGGGGGGEEDQFWLLGLSRRKRPAAKEFQITLQSNSLFFLVCFFLFLQYRRNSIASLCLPKIATSLTDFMILALAV